MNQQAEGWMEQDWLVIDTETTGLDPEHDRIVELAAVPFRAGQPLERRGMLLDPGIPIPEEASAVHGITDERVRGKPSLGDVAPRFLEMVRAAPVLVAYNWPFDDGMLRATCPGWEEATQGKTLLDPLVIVRLDGVGRYWRGPGRHRLENVFRRVVSDEVPGAAHRASTDAVMAGQILWSLREHLPADGEQAAAFTEEARARQQADFEAWKARQAQQES